MKAKGMVSLCLSAVMTVAAVCGVKPADVLAAQAAEETVWETPAVQAAEAALPGEVIVCIRESKDAEQAREEAGLDALSEAEALLYGAEELMDVSDASMEAAGEEEASLDALPLRTTLQYITSDCLTTQELIGMLSALPEVAFAEPNYRFSLEDMGEEKEECLTDPEEMAVRGDAAVSGFRTDQAVMETVFSEDDFPADPEKTLSDPGEALPDLTTYQYAYGDGPGGMDVPDWNVPGKKNAEGVVVAVIDTGVDYTNPELSDIMWDEGLNYETLRKMGGGRYGFCAMDCDTSGRAYDPADPMDDNGHGTHCAGIIAASWDGRGVSGAVNGARIMAVKSGNDRGGFSYYSILKGFAYVIAAKKAGVKIVSVNNSYGGPTDSRTYALAVQELAGEGVLSVFAAGNEDEDTDYNNDFSITFTDVPGVITVGASDNAGDRTTFSNSGIRTTDLFAPGLRILSTAPEGTPESALIPGLLTVPARDKSGTVMKNDHETEAGYFSVDNYGLFVTLSVEEDPKEAGNHALRAVNNTAMTSKNSNSGFITLTPPLNADPDPGDGLSLVLRARSEQDRLSILIYAADAAGNLVNCGSMRLSREYQCVAARLPANTDYSDLKLVIFVRTDRARAPEDRVSVWVDDLYLTKSIGSSPYCYMNGTSMAAPAVTGEAALIAAAFPGESPAKWEARILGGARCVEGLAAYCRTGGIANVRNSVSGGDACMPVVGELRETEEHRLEIDGYFFGRDREKLRVELSQNGRSFVCAVTAQSFPPGGDADYSVLTVDKPEGLTDGEVTVTVINEAGAPGRQRGRRVVVLKRSGTVGRYLKRLPVSVDAEEDPDRLFKLVPNCMTAVNGKLYLFATEFYAEGYEEYRLEAPAGTGEFTLSGAGTETEGGYMGNVCAFNGKLCYFDEYSRFTVYDPAENRIMEKKTLSEVNSDFTEGEAIDLFTLGSAGGSGKEELLLFNTQEESRTEVWRIDPFTMTMDQLTTLRAMYHKNAVYGLYRTDKGREVYIGLGSMKAGEKRSVVEKLVFGDNGSLIAQEYVSKNALPADADFTSESPSGFGTKRGIYLTGCFTVSSSDAHPIRSDLFYLDFSDPSKGFQEVTDRQLSPTRTIQSYVTGYRDQVYFLGMSGDTQDMVYLATLEEETWDQGDVQSCPYDGVTPPDDRTAEVTSLKKTGEYAENIVLLTKGDRITLSCAAEYPASMKEEERPDVVYVTGNPGVVSVHPLDGRLSACYPGATTVTAYCGNKSVSWEVTVTAEADPSALPEELEMTEGEVAVPDFEPDFVTGREKVIWTVADGKVASVKDGLVTAKKPGVTTISVTVKDGKRVIASSDCVLTVKAGMNLASVREDKAVTLTVRGSAKAEAGETLKLEASISGKEASGFTEDHVIAFYSSNTDILKPDPGTADHTKLEPVKKEKKLVYTGSFAVKAPGTAFIYTLTMNTRTGAKNIKRCRVTVTAPVKAIEWDYSGAARYDEATGTLYMKKDSCARLYLLTDPELSTDRRVSCSAKGGCVTVRNGVIQAKKVSTKNRSGQVKAGAVTLKCGRVREVIPIIVEE